MNGIPLFARKFLLDFVETAIGLVFALSLVIPGDLDQAKAEALLVGAAVISAAVSALRRAAPAFIGWLAGRLNVSGVAVGEPPTFGGTGPSTPADEGDASS